MWLSFCFDRVIAPFHRRTPWVIVISLRFYTDNITKSIALIGRFSFHSEFILNKIPVYKFRNDIVSSLRTATIKKNWSNERFTFDFLGNIESKNIIKRLPCTKWLDAYDVYDVLGRYYHRWSQSTWYNYANYTFSLESVAKFLQHTII